MYYQKYIKYKTKYINLKAGSLFLESVYVNEEDRDENDQNLSNQPPEEKKSDVPPFSPYPFGIPLQYHKPEPINQGALAKIYPFDDDYYIKVYNEMSEENKKSRENELQCTSIPPIDQIAKVQGIDRHNIFNPELSILIEKGDLNLTQLGLNLDKDKMFNDVYVGLRHLHNYGKVHMDLKPENIVKKKDGNYFIIDFGSCVENGKKIESHTIYYTPMEFFIEEKKIATPEFDLFSFGVLYYDIICKISKKNCIFWNDKEYFDIVEQIFEPETNYNTHLEKKLLKIEDVRDKEILRKLLAYNPSERLKIYSLVDSPK